MSRGGSFGSADSRRPRRARRAGRTVGLRVTAGILGLLGVAALAAGALLLRRGGSGYRVGRLLAAVPQLSLAETIALARSGEQRYVRTSGRITSDEEFPDENDRPL